MNKSKLLEPLLTTTLLSSCAGENTEMYMTDPLYHEEKPFVSRFSQYEVTEKVVIGKKKKYSGKKLPKNKRKKK